MTSQTYEDVLIARGDEVLPLYRCQNCGSPAPAFCFVVPLPDDGIDTPFACADCILSARRAVAERAAQAAAQASGFDWSPVRACRDSLLTRCDWTQVPDAPLTSEMQAAWRAYRQQLRDLSDQFKAAPDASALVWPDPPA